MQRSPLKSLNIRSFFGEHSFDLSSDLHVCEYEMLFNLNSAPDILEQYRNISQANFVPLQDPITIASSLQSVLIFF